MAVSCKLFGWLASAAILLSFIGSIRATAYRIEPDDYAERANLNDVLSVVDLRVYNSYIYPDFPAQFGIFPSPTVIQVTANENKDILGGYFTSTGTKSFGEANVPFFNVTAQLAMKFSAPASQVTIDFIGRNSLATAIGVLDIYSPQGVLLNTFTSSSLLDHQIATLTFTRPQADIGYALAYSSDKSDVFGALDNLRFVIGASNPAGDFNSNGVVDAADYAVWRKGLGGTPTAAQYQTWRQNFGAHTGAGSSFAGEVPEPATLSLFTVAALLTCHRNSRQPRRHK